MLQSPRKRDFYREAVAIHRVKHWTARPSRRRRAPYWEVRNTRGVVAVVYGSKDDAELMAAAPKLCHYVELRAERGDAEAIALVQSIHAGR